MNRRRFALAVFLFCRHSSSGQASPLLILPMWFSLFSIDCLTILSFELLEKWPINGVLYKVYKVPLIFDVGNWLLISIFFIFILDDVYSKPIFMRGTLFGRELLVIFWQPGAKSCLEVPARVWAPNPQIPSMMLWPLWTLQKLKR